MRTHTTHAHDARTRRTHARKQKKRLSVMRNIKVLNSFLYTGKL